MNDLEFLIPRGPDRVGVSWAWGVVTADGVVLDGDEAPLPPTTAALCELVPGRRVLALRQGLGVVIAGASTHGAQWELLELESGWEPYEGFGAPQVRLESGRVYLTGTMRRGLVGQVTPAFHVPEEFRPSSTALLIASSGTTVVDFRVLVSGAAYVNAPADPAWVSLEGLSYAIA